VTGGNARPLPGLQQIELGNSFMGWLDFLAPALLGAVIGRRTRPRVLAGFVVAVTSILFGLLLIDVTDKLPATVPVLAGLAIAWRLWWDR
jgi:predicted branched-subunit amino acid permease